MIPWELRARGLKDSAYRQLCECKISDFAADDERALFESIRSAFLNWIEMLPESQLNGDSRCKRIVDVFASGTGMMVSKVSFENDWVWVK
jgi:hypothetical protein